MPSLIDLRRRIRSVKSTQQITKAMKMVASSRLRRAQDRVLGARPFARMGTELISSLALRVDPATHPLLAERDLARPGSTTLLIVVTADKGLCGAFNTNIIKEAGRFITAVPGRNITLTLVGRKGRDFFRRRGYPVTYERVNLFGRLDFDHARGIARTAIEEFTSGRVDAVHLVFNEFKSILQQRLVAEQLLPIPRRAIPDRQEPPIDYIYEPSAAELLDALLPRFVETAVWQALLESAAAEHAARMTAMDAATRNAGEVIDSLTLYMNKVRQAAITREIIEVVSGAEAL
jgi:F-type H+-transporting ATPase subunit gamma